MTPPFCLFQSEMLIEKKKTSNKPLKGIKVSECFPPKRSLTLSPLEETVLTYTFEQTHAGSDTASSSSLSFPQCSLSASRGRFEPVDLSHPKKEQSSAPSFQL